MALTSNNPALFQTNGGSLQAFVLLRLPYVSNFASFLCKKTNGREQIAAIAIDAVLCFLTLLALHQARSMGSSEG